MPKYHIAFFDIDGTLVDNHADKHAYYEGVPASARKALKKLKESGVEPVIATGRGLDGVKGLAEKLGINSVIACNGQTIVYQGELLYQNFIEEEIVSLAAERFFAHQTDFIYDAVQGLFARPGYTDDVVRKVPLKYVEPGILPEKVMQLITHTPDVATIQPWLPELKVVKSGPNCANILPYEASKGAGIKILLDKLDLPVSAAVAFGDETNDLEMFGTVGTAVAMGNAVDELKDQSDFVTKETWNDGIYYACEELALF